MYGIICYHILTDGNHHPSYLFEKISMIDEGENAFGYLDYHNMKKAIDYCNYWHVPVPEAWQKEYDNQINAAKECGLFKDN